MKPTLFIALIAMILMIGLVVADPVDMSIYDGNDDRMIDANERVNLDIDIENSRLTPDESYVIDSYTMDETLILNDEFKAAFLNQEAYPRGIASPVTVVDSEPIVKPEPASMPDVTPAPDITPVMPPEGAPRDMTLLYVGVFVFILGAVIYLYNSNQNKSE